MKVRILHHRERSSRLWRFTQSFFLIAGLLALGLAGYSYAARFVYQAYEKREFDRSLAAKNATPSAPDAFPEPYPSAPSPRALIGRIAIPRLGISAIVKEGIDYRTLDLAVGHIPSTAMPGETGNVGLAAHEAEGTNDSLNCAFRDPQALSFRLPDRLVFKDQGH